MSEPITITHTIPAWLTATRSPAHFVDALNAGDKDEIVSSLYFTAHDMTDSGWTRMGEAKITMDLIPQEECVAAAVLTLQAELAREKAESYARQQAILSRISKLQSLTYEVA